MTPRRASRLPRWQELAVYLSLGGLIVTGLLWLLFDQWVRVEGEFGPEHHAAQSWLLTAHGVLAYAFLIVAGAMIPVHIILGWRLRRNLWSGISLAALCVVLAISALGLYYLGEDAARSWASLMHWSLGIAVLPIFLIHALKGRRGG
jgi:hypothetical protein